MTGRRSRTKRIKLLAVSPKVLKDYSKRIRWNTKWEQAAYSPTILSR